MDERGTEEAWVTHTNTEFLNDRIKFKFIRFQFVNWINVLHTGTRHFWALLAYVNKTNEIIFFGPLLLLLPRLLLLGRWSRENKPHYKPNEPNLHTSCNQPILPTSFNAICLSNNNNNNNNKKKTERFECACSL